MACILSCCSCAFADEESHEYRTLLCQRARKTHVCTNPVAPLVAKCWLHELLLHKDQLQQLARSTSQSCCSWHCVLHCAHLDSAADVSTRRVKGQQLTCPHSVGWHSSHHPQVDDDVRAGMPLAVCILWKINNFTKLQSRTVGCQLKPGRQTKVRLLPVTFGSAFARYSGARPMMGFSGS